MFIPVAKWAKEPSVNYFLCCHQRQQQTGWWAGGCLVEFLCGKLATFSSICLARWTIHVLKIVRLSSQMLSVTFQPLSFCSIFVSSEKAQTRGFFIRIHRYIQLKEIQPVSLDREEQGREKACKKIPQLHS